MAEVAYKDQLDRSSRFICDQDVRLSYHNVGVFVEGLTPGSASLDAACTAAVTASGSASPADATLPIYSRYATWVRPDAALVMLRYYRGRSAEPIHASDLDVPRRSSISSFPWYRDNTAFDSDGRPNGAVTFAPYRDADAVADRRPQAWPWQFGTLSIFPWTVVDDKPADAISEKVGKINSNTVSQFAPSAWPIRSLYFAGYHAEPIVTSTATRWFVQYHFVYNPRKWVRMLAPVFDGTDWITTLDDANEAVTFPTFNVHD